MKTIEIIGGGTVYYVRNHLALTAPSYGRTARTLEYLTFQECGDKYDIHTHLTKMASVGKSCLETNEDISRLLDKLIDNLNTKIIFFNPALIDYGGMVLDIDQDNNHITPSGKYEKKLEFSKKSQYVLLEPKDKLIKKIRQERKDIFLVGFKNTCGANEDEQFITGMNLLESSSCNLVLAYDNKTNVNMIITPDRTKHFITTSRVSALQELVKMTLSKVDDRNESSIISSYS